uniref:CHK kinase-like domain-containing protein n=1 Tax=Glossina morsitans morsitans TaxID=37546 RepID=A0A1B0G5F7_GLOMM
MATTKAANIENPNENLRIPSWITKEYFKEILANDEPGALYVKHFTPTAAIPPGENFTSIMLRIHVDLEMTDGSTKHKSYIMKTMLDDDKGDDMINKLSLFPKEMTVYREYIPAFENFYKNIGWPIKLAPKCLLVEHKNGRINFVFEDLKEQHFKNPKRLQGCSMQLMIASLWKLAEHHAVSAVYAERNGPFPTDFQYGFFNKDLDIEIMRNAYEMKIEEYKWAMKQWQLDNVEEYIRKLPTFEQYWKCGLSTLQQRENSFNVLTHGDFWSSNIMFSEDPTGSHINDIIIVDFQICKWGSPAEDLLFFLTISPEKEIRIKEFDNFIAIYYKRLLECLKALNYQKPYPKLRDLHKDILDQRHSFYAFFAVFNHLPAILMPTDKDSNIHNFSRNDEYGKKLRLKMYTNPHYVQVAKDLFPFFHTRGIFNFEDYDE